VARFWVCYRQQDGVKCLWRNKAIQQKCAKCGGVRPARKQPKHMVALEIPYETYVELNGGIERCGICDRPRTSKDRRLDRDHDHRTGQPRGLLCVRCNKALASWMTSSWLRAAADYVDRADAA
jgi:hypothetical protein